MHRYKVKLFPELQKMREGINLRDTENEVIKIVKDYNEVSKTGSNPKYIEESSVIVGRDHIILILVSAAWLNFPTKALRYFIIHLAKIEPYKRLITDNGRLFRGECEVMESKVTDEPERELTDEEAMIELVKLFNRKDDTKLIKEIKKLLRERI